QVNREIFRRSYHVRMKGLTAMSRLETRLETLILTLCGRNASHRFKQVREQYESGEITLAEYEAASAGLAKTPNGQNLIRLLNEFSLAERALRQHTTLEEIRHVAARID